MLAILTYQSLCKITAHSVVCNSESSEHYQMHKIHVQSTALWPVVFYIQLPYTIQYIQYIQCIPVVHNGSVFVDPRNGGEGGLNKGAAAALRSEGRQPLVDLYLADCTASAAAAAAASAVALRDIQDEYTKCTYSMSYFM